jgi:UDP-2,4-diacetamido-2,4,6-trideoxy-beta-L-altropyranose hydrolase/UDP-4-amino-4,6-dideoxy-N-acetyl-beta-L-altrosamine N-acetyltransferase
MNVSLRLLTEKEIELLMEWRMRPDITRYMNTDPVLTLEGQLAWLEKIKDDPSRRDWVVYIEETPIGYVNMTDIDRVNGRCGWGWFLAGQEHRSLQLATFLEWNLYDYAFGHLGLHKLCSETFTENRFVVMLHRLCGSTEEGILRQHICKNGTYYDVSVASMLASEWEERRESLTYEKFPFEDDLVKDNLSVTKSESESKVTPLRILFIAHGGASCGMGHVMRCLTLADALKTVAAQSSLQTLHSSDSVTQCESSYETQYDTSSDSQHDSSSDSQHDSSYNIKHGTPDDSQHSMSVDIQHTISQEFEDVCFEKNLEITFLSRYPEGAAYITMRGYPVLCEESDATEQYWDIIIIDTYEVTPAYLEDWTARGKTVYIDDLNAFPYPTDMVLNGNMTAQLLGYKPTFPAQQLLLGLPYLLLRREFVDLPKREATPYPEHLLLTTGASDPANATCRLLNWLIIDKRFDALQFDVIIGPAFDKADEILELAAPHSRIQCYQNPKNMPEIMLQADIAISAGGGTLYELAACGVPTLAFIYSENQRGLVTCMEERGYLVSLGWQQDLTPSNLTDHLATLITDYPTRQAMVPKLQSLIDGQGPSRAAGVILSCFSPDSQQH